MAAAAAAARSGPTQASRLILSRAAQRHAIPIRGRRSASSASSSRFHRSDFANQPYTGSYDPNEPTHGPLADTPLIGAAMVTPRTLKQHLDQYVVGQDRAKKTMSVSVYNHYLRISELQRKEEEEHQRLQQRLRREKVQVHPVEGEWVG